MQFSPADFYYFGAETTHLGKIQVQNPARVYVGNHGLFNDRIELSVADIYNQDYEYNLKLGDWVFLNSTIKIEAINYVELGKSVIVGPNVYISDVAHEYKNFRAPIKFQGVQNARTNRVLIMDGAWIGAGARVFGNVTVGYGSVVGANSVVTKAIPDHAVAVGSPAKVIKICDYRTGEWLDIKQNPNLLKDTIVKRGVFAGYNLGLLGPDAMQILEKKCDTLAEEKEKLLEFVNALTKAWMNFVELTKQQDGKVQIQLRDNLVCLEALQKKVYSVSAAFKIDNVKLASYFQYINETLATILDSMLIKKLDEVLLLTETRILPGLTLLRDHIVAFF